MMLIGPLMACGSTGASGTDEWTVLSPVGIAKDSESDWEESKWVMAAFSAASQVFTAGLIIYLLDFICITGRPVLWFRPNIELNYTVYMYSALSSWTKYNQVLAVRQ